MCERDGRFIKPCNAMLKSLDNQKGLFLQNLINFKTNKRSSDRVILKAGEFRKNGIAFSFCPFNGADITTWEAVRALTGGDDRAD